MTSSRIDTTFERLRSSGRLGLFPYLTAGYPELDATERLIEVAENAGADGLELGVPFSDPLADGATMQRASEVALANGVSLAWSLELVDRVRARVAMPVVLMTYYNPVHHYGLARFVSDAMSAGVDGIIVPDLPSTEAGPLDQIARGAGLPVVQLVAPTTTDERLAEVGRTATGFVYCVSLIGITGARTQLSDRLPSFMASVRKYVHTPLAVGFGISRPEHIAAIKPYADAAIIGSSIADLLAHTEASTRDSALAAYIAELSEACGAPAAITP